MTTLALRQFGFRVWSRPLVQGFVGAVLALVMAFCVVKVYGIARWHLYGRNNERLNAVETRTNQIYNYLVQQQINAAKAEPGK
jgi:hypothetical protein